MARPSGYSDLAALLTYPEAHTLARADAWLDQWRHIRPTAAQFAAEWRTYASALTVSELQELYTRTFDLNPCCSLDIGYYMFGEDYQRGVFMAVLRERFRETGLDCGAELPDHLPHLLRWLERVFGSEEHVELVSECLVPALVRMDQSFDPREGERPDRRERSTNPYRALLRATAVVLRDDLADLGIGSPALPFADSALDAATPSGCTTLATSSQRVLEVNSHDA